MFNKRTVIIGLVILAIVGLIGNHFFPTEDKPAPPVAKKAEKPPPVAKKAEKPPPVAKKAEKPPPVAKKVEKPPPTHSGISGIDPYTVADIHAIVGNREKTIERILYRARWNLESDPTNQKYIDRNIKMRDRYKNSVDEKLLRAITLVAINDQSVGYNAL